MTVAYIDPGELVTILRGLTEPDVDRLTRRQAKRNAREAIRMLTGPETLPPPGLDDPPVEG